MILQITQYKLANNYMIKKTVNVSVKNNLLLK